MVQLHVERTIAASPERVFGWLADPAHLASPLVLKAGWAKDSSGPGVALPGIGLGRPLTDGDHVADLTASVRTLLSARPSYRTIGTQTVEHAGVKHFPRRHIQIPVDRFMRDLHRYIVAKLLPQPLGDLLR
jgi:hypothetical protein